MGVKPKTCGLEKWGVTPLCIAVPRFMQKLATQLYQQSQEKTGTPNATDARTTQKQRTRAGPGPGSERDAEQQIQALGAMLFPWF